MSGMPEGQARINFNCPTGMRDALEHFCTRAERPIASVMRQLIYDHLARQVGSGALKEVPDFLRQNFLEVDDTPLEALAPVVEPSIEDVPSRLL